MRNTPFLFVPFLCASAAAQYVTLQPLPARGMMPAFQAGMTFDSAPNTIVRKEPRLPVQLDTFAPGGSNSPNYDIDDIAAWISAQTGENISLEVDAMSTGNDVLPVVYDTVSSTYLIQAGNSNGWATLYLSRIDPADPSGGADIFGYYFDNPAFPSGLTKSIYREVVRADYLPGTLAPPAGANIVALDINMGLIHSNQGFVETPVLPENHRLYFSLSHASAANVAAAMSLPNPGSINGAAIFVATYNATTGQLEDVSLHCTGADLGVPAETNIDALGVAKVSQPAPATVPAHKALVAQQFLYIISLDDGEGAGEELFVSAVQQDPGQPMVRRWAPLRTDDGLKLVGQNGRLAGYVKSLCAQDPDSPRGTHSFGVPGIDTFVVPGTSTVMPSTMNLSVTAIGTGPSAPSDAFQLHGVLSGGTYAGETLVGMWFTFTPMQLSFFTLLPNRPAGNQPYSFTTPIDVPWQIAAGSSVGINEYEVVLLTAPVSGPGLEVSTRAQLRRVGF